MLSIELLSQLKSNSIPGKAKGTQSLNNMVNSFLISVIQTYGNGGAIKIPGNTQNTNSQISLIGNKKPSSSQNTNIEKKIFRRLRKFSKKSVENMMKMSNFGSKILLSNVQTPKSSMIPWSMLKRVLTRGIRGPDVARYFTHGSNQSNSRMYFQKRSCKLCQEHLLYEAQ